MKILVTGDTHGHLGIKRLSPDLKADVVIILGDFGGVWSSSDTQTLDYVSQLPYEVLFIDGNHENFELLYQFPVSDLYGAQVRRILPNLAHLMRGVVYEIGDKTIFTFGGAASIDRVYRMDRVSWWKEELPNWQEMELGMASLASRANKVDYILTHTCPNAIKYLLPLPVLYDDFKDPTEDYLTLVSQEAKFKRWYFGHFHVDTSLISKKYKCLYTKFVELT